MGNKMEDKQEDSKNFGIYLLPNLFTTAAIFSGFFAIVAAINHNFSTAAIAIFISAILDSLDGRVARMTNTQSTFGAEYDSLADIVSFGVAPALIIYLMALHDIPQIGWIVSFIFLACNALRLAKFNANLGKGSKRYFFGLPVPAAACFLSAIIWVADKHHVDGVWFAVILGIVSLYVSGMMVSNVKYRSFKDIDFKGKIGFRVVVFIVLIFAGIAIYPAYVLLVAFGLYAISGPFVHFFAKDDDESDISLNMTDEIEQPENADPKKENTPGDSSQV
jgi:CDP-diacylglycerol--serine O-phosphatidyltransferase